MRRGGDCLIKMKKAVEKEGNIKAAEAWGTNVFSAVESQHVTKCTIAKKKRDDN